MIGFIGYMIGWVAYVLSAIGVLHFSFNVLGTWRRFLVFKMIWAFFAAVLLAPWHIVDTDTDYWVPAAVVSFINAMSDGPEEALVYMKPIAMLLAVFWVIVVVGHFIRKRRARKHGVRNSKPAATSSPAKVSEASTAPEAPAYIQASNRR